MEPLSDYRRSVWYRAYWEVDTLTPDSEVWYWVFDYLWLQFDRPFSNKDK